MPIYEFECKKCGTRFEKKMSYTDPQPTECSVEGCDGEVRKIFSPPAIMFKGSGFHVNDYSKTGPKCSSCPGGSCAAD